MGLLEKNKKHKGRLLFTRIFTLVIAFVALSGCSMIYNTTGSFIYDYSENYALPYSLTSDDIQMNCSLANVSVPLLMSFSTVKDPANKQMIALSMMTGACAEFKAQEAVLDSFRAFKQQNSMLAKDARIRAKRLYALAAKRQYIAYKYLIDEFGDVDGECPSLDEDDEFFWLAGMLSGMQAVMSDMQAQGAAGVPQDLPMKAQRGIQCLDNKKWWGIPNAIEASVWIIFKENAPRNVNPWRQLHEASAYGAKQGVRLASTIEIIAADGFGSKSDVRQAIKRYADSIKKAPSSKKYKMMDVMAKQQILAISDRMWTQATGFRTPINGLGTFWDEKSKPASTLNLDDLLGN